MSKILFGNNTVAPVKIPGQEVSAGRGIDADLLRGGTIQVDNTVLRSSCTNASGSVIIDDKNASTDGAGLQTAYGRYTVTNGEGAIAIGNSAKASQSSISIGNLSDTRNSGTGNCISIGSYSKARGNGSVTIGVYANNTNSYDPENAITIGKSAFAGNAYGAIVIGANSKGGIRNSACPSIIIGNDIDLSGKEAHCSVIIGGVEDIEISTRRSVGMYSTAIGYNSGATYNSNANNFVTIGAEAEVSENRSVAIGYGARAYGDGTVSLGKGALVQTSNSWNEGNSSVAIGDESRCYSDTSVVIGTSSKAYGTENVVVGAYAEIGNVNRNYNRGIAIGRNAKISADDTIQLGEGTNSTTNTFQVCGRRLLDMSTGLIPKERLSSYSPLDGQVLTYDDNMGTLVWRTPSQSSGSVTIPVASRTVLGGVKVGTGLSVTTEGVLSATQQNIEWGDIQGKIKDQTDLKTELDSKQKILQYIEMPTPSNKWDGQVVQYVGDPDSVSYSVGNFYKCVEDYYPTASVNADTEFGQLSIDAWTFANFISKYFYNEDLEGIPSKRYEIEYVDQFDGLGWIIYENESSYYVKDIYKMGITAEGGTPEEGDRVYVQLNMHSATGWAWRKLLIDAQVSVNNTLNSTSTKQALSANMGRVLYDKIKELSGISNFLAMWDTDTGIARYLDVGYVYHSGDYFIIAETMTNPLSAEANVPGYTFEYLDKGIWESIYGTSDTTVTFKWTPSGDHVGWYDEDNDIVAQEPSTELGIKFNSPRGSELGNVGDEVTITYNHIVNYKPAGAMYPGDTPASKEITTDPVQVSDMYFYDGEHWIFLPSSSRQIAVDETINSESRNPVENRVISAALNNKLDKSNSGNVVYVNDNDGNNCNVALGSGLDFDWDNMEIINTKQGAWGDITGNIEDQTDLVQYIGSHGGGGQSPLQLMDVFNKERQDIGTDSDTDWKGDYSKIYVRLGGNFETLKNSRFDGYITISHSGDSSHSKKRKKMRVMNDCNRFKTDKKFYCWRIQNQMGRYYWESRDGEWEWDYDQYPTKTQYTYFYVDTDYQSSNAMVNANPQIWICSTYDQDLYRGNWGTNFNELFNYGSLNADIDEAPYERCPEFDIDSVVSLNSNFQGSERSSEYSLGNVVKNEFHKMCCRVYNVRGSGKVYLWAVNNWNIEDDNDVYGYYDDNDELVSNYIPDFMGDIGYQGLTVTTVLNNPSDFTFVETRPDLNWYKFAENKQFEYVINDLRLSTQDFPDQEGSTSGWCTNWNSYWLDYPVKPIRISDCKLYVYKSPYAEGSKPDAQQYARWAGKPHTWDEVLNDEKLLHMVENQDDIILELPYDTHYLWMRIYGWQKMVYYRQGNRDNDIWAEPWERHDLHQMIEKCRSGQIGYLGRMYGYRNLGQLQSSSNMYFYRLQFNSISGKDLGQNKVSMNIPISRKMFINGVGTQRLTENM